MATMKMNKTQQTEKKFGAIMCPVCGSYDLAYIGFTSVECWTAGCANMTKEDKKAKKSLSGNKYFAFNYGVMGNVWFESNKDGEALEGGETYENEGGEYEIMEALIKHGATHAKGGVFSSMKPIYEYAIEDCAINREQMEKLGLV